MFVRVQVHPAPYLPCHFPEKRLRAFVFLLPTCHATMNLVSVSIASQVHMSPYSTFRAGTFFRFE